MITGILVFVLIALALGLVLGSAGPSTKHARNTSETRRQRYVQRNPDQVNSLDITRMLEDAGLPDHDVRLIIGKARQLGIRPFTMLMWLKRYDARALAIVVAADLTHTELLTHLGEGSLPDLEDLRVFAELNGLPVKSVSPELRTGRAPVPRPVIRTNHKSSERGLPPIFEPGDSSYFAPVATETPKPKSSGLGDWAA